MSGRYVTLHIIQREEDSCTRFGFVVSKSVGNAVTRNLLKRRYKSIAVEINKMLNEHFGAYDVVFRVKNNAARVTFSNLKADLESLYPRLVKQISKHG